MLEGEAPTRPRLPKAGAAGFPRVAATVSVRSTMFPLLRETLTAVAPVRVLKRAARPNRHGRSRAVVNNEMTD